MPGVIEQEVRSKTVRTTPPFYHLYALSLGSRWGITCFDGFSSSAIPERGFVKRAGTIFIVSAPIVLTPDRSSKLSVRSQKEVGHSQIFLFLKALGPDKYIYMCGVSLMCLHTHTPPHTHSHKCRQDGFPNYKTVKSRQCF
jgi:hypothetical protein